MTSFAFILGVTPLAVAWGAGSASQNAIGTGVIGGMLTATLLAIFLVPVFYVVVRRIFKGRSQPAPAAAAAGGDSPSEMGGNGTNGGDAGNDRQPQP
jgi:multidrug efflux pump